MLGLKKKVSCGLQILDDQVRLVVIRSGSKKLLMKKHHSEPLPLGAIRNGKIVQEDAVAGAIKKAANKLGIQGYGIYLAVPTSSTVLRKSSFPVMNDKELRNMIDVELSSGSQMPFKDPVFDFVRLGTSTVVKQEEVLIFASPANVVESYVRVVKQAGLKPLTVELASLASLRLLYKYEARNRAKLPDSFIVINAEESQLEFSIFVEGVPVFLHSVTDVSSGEAYYKTVTTELSRIMYYFNYSISENQDEIAAIYLLGAEEILSGLPLWIKEIYEGPIQTISLNAWLTEQIEPMQAYAIPIGLALKGA